MGSAHELRPLSPFMEAFYDYVRNLPEKKNKKSVLSHLDINNPPTPDDIQDSIRQLEVKHGQKPSVKVLKRVLSPIVMVLKDYYGVLDSLTQADPTPSCIIWGTLKIVIDGLSRFIDLFERIQNELLTLNIQLRRLILYEDLYGQSTDMQEHLFRSYKNIFRFWCRVDKECNRNSLNSLLRASVSFSTKKLQSIIEDLKENADQIEKLAPIIEAQFAGDDRAEAAHERLENKKERDEGSAWRQQMQSDRIRSWLGGQTLTESILARHRSNLEATKLGSTCDWLAHDTTYQSWTDETLNRPVLWLHAGPGSGKSTLCSYAIKRITQLEPRSAVALLFYEFDDSQRTALSMARALATQLFDYYWLQHQDIPEDLRTASQKSSADLGNILDFIRLLIGKIHVAYIFIDGLDEECNVARWKEACQIFEFLLLLARDWPGVVRLWYSTQDRPVIRTRLGDFPTMNIKEKIRFSVDEYISSTVPGINNPEVDQETRTWILAELKDRAQGNFLWTSLMLKTIEAEVSSFDEMEQFIKEGLPQDLDAYYSRMFARYEPRERELASKIFGLVTFAKRRLRLSELRQAIGILSSDDPKHLKSRSIPWRQAVERLFAPLIETQEDPDAPQDCFCFLFHSTVKTFLEQHPEVLQRTLPGAATLLINEFIIANACLLYLSQDAFAELLIKDSDQWTTASKERITGTNLLTYSAKYWDKHMDGVEETSELRLKVESFIRSGNFHTTLQLQSLFVENHFHLYTLEGCSNYHKYTKRVFPRWFARHSAEGCTDVAKNYRTFTTQWNSFLSGRNHIDRRFKGELDRCLWGALGPQSFLSNGQDRYSSFMLIDKDGLCPDTRAPYCAGISSDGSEAVVLKQIEVSDPGGACPLYRIQSWTLTRCNQPRLLLEETIAADLEAKDADRPDRSCETSLCRDSREISLSPDLCCLRIGSRILVKDESGRYSEIQELEILTEDPPPYFEDVLLKASYLVLASRKKAERIEKPRARSRAKTTKTSPKGGKPLADLGSNLGATSTDCPLCSREHSKEPSPGSVSSSSRDQSKNTHKEDASERESTSSSPEEESSAWNSAEESWSEGSTSDDGNGRALLIRLDSTSEDSRSETSESEAESDLETQGSAKDDASDAPITSHGQLLDDYEGESEESNPEWVSDDSPYEADSDASDWDYRYESDDELGYSSGEQDELRAFLRSTRERKGAKPEHGLLTVYNLGAGHPVQLFKFAHPLPVRLYNSPPVVHPSCPLVVWPLCGGDILFADYEGNSYFIRQMRPTTRKARHIFIKCHFSPCGKYLHIASLEAQQKALSKKEKKAGIKDSLLISAFISTHRLSTQKTTRCPPALIHRMKFSLGEHAGLPSNSSPVEVTWTEKHVYFSSSGDDNQLCLFRVDLFVCPKGQEDAAVCVPKKPVLLPESARMRAVYYFPPRAQNERALVLVGCLTNLKDKGAADRDLTGEWDPLHGLPDRVSPPIGFYLWEEEDLGGWGPSNAVEEIKPDTAKGSLEQRMEKFSAEDDCDIEHYFIT